MAAQHSIKIHIQVGRDRTVKLPDDVPEGPAEITVTLPEPHKRRPRRELVGIDHGKFVVPDDFNDPLPADIQAYFEGHGD